MNILIKSAKIIDASSTHHRKTMDILIQNGQIKSIAKTIKTPEKCKELSLDNLHVSTGWFDSSVCFGEPGYEDSETIERGLYTAAASGFTAVAVNPNTEPKIDHKAAVEFLINKANGATVQLYPIGCLTKNAGGKDIAELYDMFNSGAIAFGDYNRPIDNANLMKIGLQYAQNFNGLVLGFPQDSSIARDGLVHEGEHSTLLGLKGIPSLAEELRVSRDLYLLEYTGGKLHIPTLSTAKSVQLIKEAKKKGLNVTCSVAAHHLTLNDSALHDFNSNMKLSPPLRTKKDVKALKKGIKEGVIDAITSDHNPITVEHKKVEFSDAAVGTIGLESLFGALSGSFELETLIDAISRKPRAVFGLPTIAIKEGSMANLTLFDPDKESLFKLEDISSTSKNSAFLNHKMQGKVYGIYAKNNLILNS